MGKGFALQFDRSALLDLAQRYEGASDREIEHEIVPRATEHGYLCKRDLVTISRWKSPRNQWRVESNPAEFVKESTRIALSTPCEELRISVLTLLRGVAWPTASVVLHFAHRDPYPIIDFRALWSLGVDSSLVSYTFDLWWEYVEFCRKLASECRLTMRDLDRALWQFSKENQKQAPG